MVELPGKSIHKAARAEIHRRHWDKARKKASKRKRSPTFSVSKTGKNIIIKSRPDATSFLRQSYDLADGRWIQIAHHHSYSNWPPRWDHLFRIGLFTHLSACVCGNYGKNSSNKNAWSWSNEWCFSVMKRVIFGARLQPLKYPQKYLTDYYWLKNHRGKIQILQAPWCKRCMRTFLPRGGTSGRFGDSSVSIAGRFQSIQLSLTASGRFWQVWLHPRGPGKRRNKLPWTAWRQLDHPSYNLIGPGRSDKRAPAWFQRLLRTRVGTPAGIACRLVYLCCNLLSVVFSSRSCWLIETRWNTSQCK